MKYNTTKIQQNNGLCKYFLKNQNIKLAKLRKFLDKKMTVFLLEGCLKVAVGI